MISQKMQDALNEQIQAEMYSSNLYLSMAAHFESANYKGFAHWMRLQADEERMHALKLYDYLNTRQGRTVIKAIAQPPKDFGSPFEVFKQTLAHEQKVTAMINKLYEAAIKEKDYATQGLLQGFVAEQVEEEANASATVERLKMIGDKSSAVLWVDKELGKRA